MSAQILIVEDQALVAKDIENKLLRAGYGIAGVAVMGAEAIELARLYKPDLILMDVRLGAGIDGIQAASQIRTFLDAPVIYLTAYTDEDTLQRARLTGPYGYLAKPFAERELRGAIEVALYKHEMEKKLRASEEQYRLITQNASELIWIMDPDLKPVFISPSFTSAFGYQIDEISQLSWEKNLAPHSYNFAKDVFDEVIHSPEYWDGNSEILRILELEFIHKNGTSFWGEVRCTVLRDAHGHPSGVLGIGRDITERKRLEDELLRSSDLLKSIRKAQALYIAHSDMKTIFAELLQTAISSTSSEYGFLDEVFVDEKGEHFKRSLAISNISWNAASQALYQDLEQSNFTFTNLRNLAGLPALLGDLVIANDIPHDPRAGGLPAGHPVLNSFLGIPLFYGGELVGVLGMANRPGGYQPQMAEFLEPFSSTCAGIIHAARQEQHAKETANALRENEELQRALLNASMESAILIDTHGVILAINEVAARRLRTSSEALIGINILDLLPPELAASRKTYLDLAITTEETVHFTDERDGMQFEHNIQPVKDSSGKITRLAIYALDVTVRKTAEAERQQRQHFLELLNQITLAILEAPNLDRLLHTLANHLGDMIHADICFITRWDEQRQLTIPAAASGELNEVYLQVKLLPGETTITKTALEQGSPIVIEDVNHSTLISPRITTPFFQAFSMLGLPLMASDRKLGAALIAFKQPHVFTDEEIELCAQAAKLVSLALDKMILLENTRQRTAEMEALANLSAAMREAPDRSSLLSSILDYTSRMFFCQAAAIISHDPNRIDVGGHYFEAAIKNWTPWIGKPVPNPQSVCNQVFLSGTPHLDNNSHCHPCLLPENYLEGLAAIACTPLIAQDTTIGVLSIGRALPISEADFSLLQAIGNMAANAIHRQTLHENLANQVKALQNAQTRLVQSEKLAAVGRLIAGVSHELNNPLTSVLLFAQMAHQRVTDPDAKYELSQIASEAGRAANIVRGLLDFARQRRPERKPVQIGDILTSSLSLLAYEMRSHDIIIDTDLSDSLPLTMADSSQLQQVLINLFTNARQALMEVPRPRRLQINAQTRPSTFLGPYSGQPNVIRVTIQDNGPGISDENLPHIFDPFFSTKREKGVGLGLPICHGIISEHGGHIWAESQPGQGACFIIEIPILETPQHDIPTAAPPKARSTPDENTPHLLVIDDEPSVLEVVSRTLRRAGYHVDIAESGAKGLALVTEHDYQLVLCDIRMPEMNGKAFYQHLKEQDEPMTKRILFTTGDTISQSTRRFLSEAKIECLTKPFEMDELLSKVSSLL